MKYFVTGATGFIGGRVAAQLRAGGHDVVALVRDPSRAAALAAAGVQLARGDLTDPATLTGPMAGVHGVFHVAGWHKLGASDRAAAEAANVQGTRNVLTAMRDLQIPRGVYTSTLAVNADTRGQLVDESYRYAGRYVTVFGRTMAAALRVADEFVAAGLPLVVLQPGRVYGPGDTGHVRTLFVKYLTHRLPMLPQDTAYSWAHVDDVARAHLLAMERGRPGERYIVSGPTHTVVEALDIAEGVCGIPAPRVAVAPWAMHVLSAAMGFLERFVTVPESYTGELLRVRAGATYIGNDAKARRELGWEPRPLSEGLTETLRHEIRLLGRS